MYGSECCSAKFCSLYFNHAKNTLEGIQLFYHQLPKEFEFKHYANFPLSLRMST
jgi:hypothetical protein